MNVATLGLRIDGRDMVVANAQALDNLTRSAEKTETAAKRLTDSTRQMTLTHMRALEVDRQRTQAAQDAVRQMTQAHTDALRMDQARTQSMTQLVRTQQAVTTATAGSTVGLGRLNNGLQALAIQATGTDPVVGRLVGTISGFALGSAGLTAAVGGLALIATWFRKIGEDARYANEQANLRLNNLLGGSQVFTDERSALIGVRGAQAALDDLRAQRAALGTGAGGHRGVGLTASLDEQIAAAERRVLALQSILGEVRAGNAEFVGPTMSGDPLAAMLARANAGVRSFDVLQLPGLRERMAAQVSWSQLWQSGQAGGGVPQMSPAAHMAPRAGFPIPPFASWADAWNSGQQNQTGWGGGLGFMGSAMSGSIGSMAGGFTSALNIAGPAGAIVGAVGSIVDGLMGQGQRAQAAARQWRNTLEEFALMFDEVTPEIQLDQAFKGLSGGFSVDEVRARIAALSPIAGNFTTDPTGGIQRQVDKYRDLLRVYEENAKQAGTLADKERELYDARFRTLNAPAGFNAAAFGYRVGSQVDMPAGTTTTAGPTVVVLIDGEELRARVETRRSGSFRGAPGVPVAR